MINSKAVVESLFVISNHFLINPKRFKTRKDEGEGTNCLKMKNRSRWYGSLTWNAHFFLSTYGHDGPIGCALDIVSRGLGSRPERVLSCVPEQNTSFSQYLFPPRSIKGYRVIIRKDWWNAGGNLASTSIPSCQESARRGISAFSTRNWAFQSAEFMFSRSKTSFDWQPKSGIFWTITVV